MTPGLLSLFLLAALAGSSGRVHAEKADRTQPMNIEADALRHDEPTRTSVFSGHVVLTQGSIVLRGARLEMRQDADGHQHGLVTAEAGKRAFFRQKRDRPVGAPEEFIEGESERIEYDGKADTVRLSTRAELRRYRAALLSDQITGAVIVYSHLTEVFTVDGQPSAPAGNAAEAAPAPAGRVRAVLAPKNPPPAAAAPAAPASAPVLRPDNSLGSPR